MEGAADGSAEGRPGDGGTAPSSEAVCTKAALTCSTHERCDGSSGTAVCACVVGYTRQAAVCVWTGGPANPGFTSLDAWRLTNANIDPNKSALIEPGVLALPGYGSAASQSFPMPAFADAEPFALVVTGRVGPATLPAYGGPLRPFVGGGLASLPGFGTAFGDKRTCLGERAYGGTIELALVMGRTSAVDAPLTEIDHVAIVPAPDCPPFGTIPNHDFEGTENWKLTSSSGAAAITAGVGTQGSRGGRIATTTYCQYPTISAAASAPGGSLARPAISFSYKGTVGRSMLVDLGDFKFAAIGTGAFETARVCLPEHAKGSVAPLTFRLPPPGELSYSCGTADEREFIVDDVAFVSDPTCPETALLTDAGFEQAAVAKSSSWVTVQPTDTVADFGGQPRTGTAALRVGSGRACADAIGSQTVTVPLPEQAGGTLGGPAIRFWYRIPTPPGGSKTTFDAFVDGASVTLAPTDTYAKATLCLDPKAIGRSTTVSFRADGGTGSCATTFPMASMFVDDVEVGHEPACPLH